MKQYNREKKCPNCFNLKKIYDGSDYNTCHYCHGEGKVSKEKYNSYDPMDIKIIDNEFDNNR